MRDELEKNGEEPVREDSAALDRRSFLRLGTAVAAVSALDQNLAYGQASSVPRENWSGTYHFHTDRVFQPQDVAAVVEEVRSTAKLRALGTRHSFNGIADSSSAQISMLGLKNVEVNAGDHSVRAGAGVRLGDLAIEIDKQGWALHNLPSLPHISLAGAVTTATHGSGDGNQNLAAFVRGIELVDASGDVVELAHKRSEYFSEESLSLRLHRCQHHAVSS